MTSSHNQPQWNEMPLIELLSSLETGARPKGGVDRFKTGVPSLGGEHLTADGKFFLRNLKFIPEDFAVKLTRGRISRGDVLIVKDGATTGKCVLVSESFPLPEAYINEHVFLCRFWPVLESRFFAYFLRSELGQKRILDNFRGAAQGGIPQSFAKNTLVPVAPAAEQKRIADKLDRLMAHLDTCREHLERVPGILKRFRQAVLAAAISGQLTKEWRKNEKILKKEIDLSWKKTPLSKLCQKDRIITYGVIKLGEDIPEGVPCLRTSNVRWLSIDLLGVKRISQNLSHNYSRTILQGGEVLVNVRGTLGGVAVAPLEMSGWNVSREVAVIPVDSSLIDAKYLAFFIGSVATQQWLGAVQKGVAYIGINIEDLRTLPIDLPHLMEQKEVVRRVEALFDYADRLETKYQSARKQVDELTPALLAKAFRGELVAQDPNDEPASVLLERIRAEREARAKETGQHRKPTKKKIGSKVEGVMRKLSEITPTHLSDILKDNGSMLPERLWAASELEIEDFFDQLKDEELKGLLKEIRNPISDLVVMLEAL